MQELHQLLKELNLLPYQETITQFLRPAIYMNTKPNKHLPIGASKIGGNPDLPPHFQFPTYADGKQQTFLAQYRLADLTAFSTAQVLPPSGMLYFFHLEEPYDNHDRLLSWQSEWAAWSVIYWDGDESTLQPYHPESFIYPQAQIHFELGWSGDIEALIGKLFPRESDVDPINKLYELEEQLALSNLTHQLLGSPIAQQPWYQVENPEQKTLLLQLDSDRQIEMIWGDCGTVYFFISPEDLKKRDFTKIDYEYQWG
ncbi:Uncharacterized protein YwqG [Seinonella peptonophila]|uniref:Uncharacterized protein YwqG n=1 Tax=Seinonella peptonophila TaxID=112248 RepID=A0A1M4U2M3_9BACL|nr:Uncharacterized protein YwqG [Seinonella peptonophila]